MGVLAASRRHKTDNLKLTKRERGTPCRQGRIMVPPGPEA